MNCATHPEVPAVAFCRTCGKALCADCRHEWQGVVYCATCVAPLQTAAPLPPPQPLAPTSGAPSPGLAFFLGLIPGVGAIYNGQYGKGIVHVVILGLLISILDSNAAGELQPLFVLMTIAWFFYMAMEAYHTAKKRLVGEHVDEFSGLLQVRRHPGRLPVGPLVLILLGFVFLLNTLGYLSFDRLARFWPVILIVVGVYLLYARLAGASEPAGSRNPNSGPDQQL